jgi:hypothetical protein
MNISDLRFEADTLAACYRNKVSDVTFYDQNNFILNGKISDGLSFPFEFLEKSRLLGADISSLPVSSLREGLLKISGDLHYDWMVFFFMLALLLYFVAFSFSKRTLPELARFFSYKRTGDELSRDSGSVFTWQSTFINLVSFLNLGLFASFCLGYFVPQFRAGNSFTLFVLLSAALAAAVTLRHITCTVTGFASRQTRIFDEYIITIYLSYRYSGLILFILSILISYTSLLPVKYLIFCGLAIFLLFYLLRLARLAIIFVSRGVSILYLILYLCALEFLPVLISVKYLTGLF